MIVRIVLMLGIAFGTYQLVVWNRAYDPRFYHFLSTRPGRTLARMMNWPSFFNLPPQDKPESEFTPEELSWKRQIENHLEQSWPSHRLILQTGEEFLIRILSENPRAIQVQQSFGGQGRVIRDIDRSEIAFLGPFTEPIPHVTWRDVRFQMQFPDFQLLHVGKYTVVTDAPYFQVIESIRTLETLYRDYMEIFGELVRPGRLSNRLQVVLFSNEEQYRRHQSFSAPGLETSAGFYSPLEDRMVVFNQFHSIHTRNMRAEIDQEIADMLEGARSEAERRSILAMRQHVEDQLRERGRRETTATLRHEGAHHLSYTLGIHSWHHAENGWLIEGLAVYFESSPPGLLPDGHRGTLFQLLRSGRIPPLRQLMAVRKPENFERELPGFTTYEAYALSWALFHLAMEPQHRGNFFEYLEHIRDGANVRNLMLDQPDQLLADFLGMSPDALERQWILHMHQMLGIGTGTKIQVSM